MEVLDLLEVAKGQSRLLVLVDELWMSGDDGRVGGCLLPLAFDEA